MNRPITASRLVNVRIGALFPITERVTDERLVRLDNLMSDMCGSVKGTDERTDHPYLSNAMTDLIYNQNNEAVGINFSLFNGRRENFLADTKFLLGADEDTILSDAAWTAERLVGRLHGEMPEINFAAVAARSFAFFDEVSKYLKTLPYDMEISAKFRPSNNWDSLFVEFAGAKVSWKNVGLPPVRTRL